MTLSANTGKKRSGQHSFDHGINHVVVSKDGRLIATSDVDMNVRVESNGNCVFDQNFQSENEKIRPTDRIRGLCFSEDSSLLWVASGDRVLAFSTRAWLQVWEYVAPRSFGFLIISPIALDSSKTGDFVGAFDNGSMSIWSQDGIRKHTIRDNDSPRWLRYSEDGSSIMGTDSFSVCRWNLPGGKSKEKIALSDRAFGFASSPDCKTFAIRTLSEILIRDFDSRTILSKFRVGASIPLLAFHPSEPLVIYGEQNCIRVVDYSGQVLEEKSLDVASALSIGFADGGKRLLVGCTELNLIQSDFSVQAV